MSAWRSPETAPKDGTRILAVLSDIKRGEDLGKIVEIVFWRQWWPALTVDDGWQRVDAQCGGHYPVVIDKWMPLPAP